MSLTVAFFVVYGCGMAAGFAACFIWKVWGPSDAERCLDRGPGFAARSPLTCELPLHHDGAHRPFAKSGWFDRIWRDADAVVAPGVEASKFVGGPIFMPVFAAAFGAECVAALARLGRARS